MGEAETAALRDPVLRDRAFWLRFLHFWLFSTSSFRTSWGAAYEVTKAWPGMKHYRRPL